MQRMAQTSRTLNPLPFRDLEPHRFEDLVRQLAYEFRDWRSIEATGRSGSDEGVVISHAKSTICRWCADHTAGSGAGDEAVVIAGVGTRWRSSMASSAGGKAPAGEEGVRGRT
jgi:hypothetical protein